MENRNFQVGQLVFAKMKFFPAWPAKISELLPQNNRVEAMFFGEFKKAVITPDNLFLYSNKTKLQFDVESSRRRLTFNKAMEQIEEAWNQRNSAEENQIYSGNITDSHQQDFVESASDVQVLDEFDRFVKNLRSKISNLKATNTVNPNQKTNLMNHELVLIAIELKSAASIDEPDPDHALEILGRLLSEVLPETTRSQLLNNADLVEVLALLTDYKGNDDTWEFNESLRRIVEDKVANIRALAEEALEKIKELFPSLPRENPETWTSFVFHAAFIKTADCSQVPSSLTQL